MSEFDATGGCGRGTEKDFIGGSDASLSTLDAARVGVSP